MVLILERAPRILTLILTTIALGAGPALAQDLALTALSAPTVEPIAVDFDVTVTAENLGTVDAGPFVIQLFGDGSPGVDSDDEFFGETIVPGLAAGATSDVTFSVHSPQNYREEIYYLGARVDAHGDVEETDEDNNWRVDDADTITFTATADLTLRSVNLPASQAAGGLVTLRAYVANDGIAPTCCFQMGFYLSDNAEITSTDTLVSEQWVGNIEPGEAADIFFNFTLPEEQPLGTYFLGLDADYDDDIDELDESNNTFSAPFQVRNASGRLAFVTPPRVVGKDECTPPIRVQVQDPDGTPRAPTGDLVIDLQRRASMYLYADARCSHEQYYAVLDASTNLATFFMRYPAAGHRPVRVAAPELVYADQTEIIIDDPDDGASYIEVSYSQRSKKVVAGQAAEFELTLIVRDEPPLEAIMLQPEHLGLKTLTIDGIATTAEGSVDAGTLQPGDEKTFRVELMPELGHLTASSLFTVAFQREGDSQLYSVTTPPLDLVISARRGLGAECGSTGTGGVGWLAFLLLFAAAFRRR